jgi:ubiquinone/menaquinone biosynthesis C-methylase UbiE
MDRAAQQNQDYADRKEAVQPNDKACVSQFEAIKHEMQLANNWHAENKFLDIGCGVGAYAEYWNSRGLLVTGVDSNASQVAIARGRAVTNNLSIVYKRADAEHLPFGSGSFNIVFANSILEHVTDWEACVQEWIRVLMPGGVLWIETTNVLCPRQGEFRWLPFYSWWPELLKRHVVQLARRYPALVNYSTSPALHWFSYFKLRTYLQKRGFAVHDRFDCMDLRVAGFAKKLARRVALSCEAGRAFGYLFVTPLILLSTKRDGMPDTFEENL